MLFRTHPHLPITPRTQPPQLDHLLVVLVRPWGAFHREEGGVEDTDVGAETVEDPGGLEGGELGKGAVENRRRFEEKVSAR